MPRTLTLPDEWDTMTAAQQTAWLNTGEFIALGGTVGEPIKAAPLPEAAKAPKRSAAAKPPKDIEDISYLPKGVAPKVERVEDTQRGKAVERVAQAKLLGTVGAAGWMADQLGAVEPIMKASKTYTPQMVAFFFVGVVVISVVLFYYGKWLRKKGERDATTLLG
jgi:hypothetical protein